jgi:hypothetical protein
MEKKQRFKIVISRKSNGKIHEFVLADDFTYEMALDFARNHFPFSDCSVLAVCPVDPPVPRMAEYVVTFEDRTDTLLCSYRVVAENGIKVFLNFRFAHDSPRANNVVRSRKLSLA